jgi:serine/threonine-protein kinase RIO1
MNKKYVVRLSDEERNVCQEIIKNLKGSSQKFRRAQILLKADADGPAWSDAKDYRTKPDRMKMMQAASSTQPRNRRADRSHRRATRPNWAKKLWHRSTD